jgi:RNA-directed DNA polymerase
MGRIEVETALHAQAGRLPHGMRMARTLDETTQEERQMTTEQHAAGASFHGVTDWHDIDWASVSHNVRRLQARIVKATKEKRWGKVQAFSNAS